MGEKVDFLYGELKDTIFMDKLEVLYRTSLRYVNWRNLCMGWNKVQDNDIVDLINFFLNLVWFKIVIRVMHTYWKRIRKSFFTFLYMLMISWWKTLARRDHKLNEILDGEFEMKYHGEVKKIQGMNIMKKWKRSELFLSQYDYFKKVVEEFGMQDVKIINTSLGHYIKLPVMQCPKPKEENKRIKSIPYTNGIRSIM